MTSTIATVNNMVAAAERVQTNARAVAADIRAFNAMFAQLRTQLSSSVRAKLGELGPIDLRAAELIIENALRDTQPSADALMIDLPTYVRNRLKSVITASYEQTKTPPEAA